MKSQYTDALRSARINIDFLNLLKITPPKQVVDLEKLPGKSPYSVDIRGIACIRADARAGSPRAILWDHKNKTQIVWRLKFIALMFMELAYWAPPGCVGIQKPNEKYILTETSRILISGYLEMLRRPQP